MKRVAIVFLVAVLVVVIGWSYGVMFKNMENYGSIKTKVKVTGYTCESSICT